MGRKGGEGENCEWRGREAKRRGSRRGSRREGGREGPSLWGTGEGRRSEIGSFVNLEQVKGVRDTGEKRGKERIEDLIGSG